MTTDTLTPTERIDAAVAELGLTLEYKFVPFSMSRNKHEKHKSLNWVVTLKRGNASFIIDYSAGIGHCPSYRQMHPNGTERYRQNQCTDLEVETGFAHRWNEGSMVVEKARRNLTRQERGNGDVIRPTIPLVPKAADVISSLVLDASVLDEPSFEAWADNLGYDKDSRSAEATYRACLDTALKLRAMIGDAGLRLLQDACQDY